MTTFQELVSLVGFDTATVIVAKFGGRVMYLPRLTGREGPRTHVKKVGELFKLGHTLGQIADATKLSIPTIVDILEMEMTTNV